MHRARRPAAMRRLVAVPIVLPCSWRWPARAARAPSPEPGDERHGGTLRLAVVASTVGTIRGSAIDPTAVGPTDQDAMVLVDLTSDSLTVDRSRPPSSRCRRWRRAGRPTRPARRGPSPPRRRHLRRRLAGDRGRRGRLARAGGLQGRPVAGRGPARRDRRLRRLRLRPGRSTSRASRRPDDHTLVITTGAPDAELPLLLGSPLYGVVKLEPASAPDDGHHHVDGRRRPPRRST